MARTQIDRDIILSRAAQIANEYGEKNVSLKMLAQELDIQSPSLYYYFKSLDDLKREVMIYGWKKMETCMLDAVIGVSGYDAIRAMCHAFYDYAVRNPGIFDIMLIYNRYNDEKTAEASSKLFVVIRKIMVSLNISDAACGHLIRTMRSLFQGFALLINHGGFSDHPSAEESFEFSLDLFIEGMKTLEGK